METARARSGRNHSDPELTFDSGLSASSDQRRFPKVAARDEGGDKSAPATTNDPFEVWDVFVRDRLPSIGNAHIVGSWTIGQRKIGGFTAAFLGVHCRVHAT